MKNITKTLIILGIALLWLPSGPSDLFIIPMIIEKIGMQMYIIISIILVVYLYNTIEGKTLKNKMDNIKKEVKKL